MKRTIAALVAGIVLGATGVATAAQTFWEERGTSYQCQGISTGMTCNAGTYQIGVTRSFVYVQHRRTKQTFGCRRTRGFDACVQG